MEGLGRSPHPSPSGGHGKGRFPGTEVALEPLSFIWKDEEAKAVALGMVFLAEGAECEKVWEARSTPCVRPAGGAGDDR